MSSHALNEALSPEMNERLRMEIGWTEVGKGLGQILLGYLYHFIGTVVGAGLILIALFGLPDERGFRTRAAGVSSLWLLYSGLAALSLVNLLGYVTVASGHFRCMMGSSERKGARWLMLFCLTCMFIGPTVNFAAGIACSTRPIDLNNVGAKTFMDMKYTQTGQYLQLTGFAISMLYPLFMLLFLRATAACMHSRVHVYFLNVFLLFAAGVAGCTGFFIYDPQHMLLQGVTIMVLGVGWLALIVGYLSLLLIMRLCVLNTMERVRSPLDY